VSWFLGIQVLNKLRSLILNALQHDFDLRDWMTPGAPVDLGRSVASDDGIWFDYIADTGDGNRAMAGLAYHLQRDLEVAPSRPAALGPGASWVAAGAFAATAPPRLPRGRFLFLGGDLAYPASDVETVKLRVLEPFRHARSDAADPPLAVYGIPGNHDYFDHLIGFNRALRAPIDPTLPTAPVTIHGYRRDQQASYVRIRLSPKWELWGIDIGDHGLDFRQLRYFRPDGEARPKCLIVCTSSPPIVLDEDCATKAHKDALALLRLSDKFDALAKDPGPELEDLECRLDLSGDTHHYARYGKVEPAPPTAGGPPIDVHRYAGVVSGGGGAFLHPTDFTGPIPARRKYPTPERSLRIASGLVAFFPVAFAGHAWIFFGFIALALYVGSADWVGALTDLPHALVGAPTMPARIPAADLAMLAGVLLSITGPLVWLGVVRPLFLRTRRHRRRHPITLPFGTTREPPWPPTAATSWLREALNRSYLVSLVWITVQLVAVFCLLVVPPWLAATLWPGATATGVIALLGAALFLLGGPWLAVTIGAEPPRPYLRLRLAFIGLLHGAMQLTLPLAILVYATPASVACVVGLWITVAAVAIRVTRLPDREPAVRPWRIRAAVTALWLLQWLGALAFFCMLATRELPHQVGIWECVIAVLVGSTICIHQLGWYLLVALLWGGHNNEAGAGVHCEDYKQWIRFHLGRDEVLTAYVIGVDRAADRSATPTAAVPAARLVDVFQLRPPA
jgi:hypothetical protein